MPFLATEHVLLPNLDLLSWIFDTPSYDIDKPILIDAAHTSRSISNRQAKELILRVTAGLQKVGVQPGDCVCVHAFNDIYYSIAFLSIVAAGGVFAGTNPSYTPYELEHYIKTADIKYWIVQPDLMSNVRSACSACGIPDSNIIAFDVAEQKAPAGFRSWSSLQTHDISHWRRFDDLETCKTTTAARLFSSGTTGLPKALDLSHHNVTSQHTLFMEYKPRPFPIRRVIPNPMFHVSQLRVHVSALKGGYVTYIMRRFELETYLANVEKFQITELNIVPAMVILVLQSGLLKKYSLKSVHHAWAGTAPLNVSLQTEFKSHLPKHSVFNQVWGMSETSGMGMFLAPPAQDSTGGVGQPLPNCDVKLVDDEGKDISAFNVRGELCMRGPIMFSGYYKNNEANQRDFDDEGYFHTGDIAYCDQGTKLWYIVDRKKELIKVRSFQVSPAEIEAVLYDHPDISETAVIGVQASPNSSELPRAYVVLRCGANLTEKEVRDYASKRLARYKNLDGGVRFVKSIPRNQNGKVMKHVLKEQAKKEMAAKL